MSNDPLDNNEPLSNNGISNNERRRQLHCPVLVTERLVLRLPHIEDMDAIADLANNRRVSAMLSAMPYPFTRKHAADFILRAVAGEMGHCVYAITLGDTGEFIGSCSVRERHDDPNGVEIGYWLGEPYWKKGYASEATNALIDTIFRATDLDSIYVTCFAANTPSRRVIQKLGFRYEGVSEQQSIVSGLLIADNFSLSREDWIEQRRIAQGAASSRIQTLQNAA
ncbi:MULTISPECIES: GNAT family N-acetyltransferase [unclassified Bartonella]|uniref:GNAT family N-acetyltransferase n=1 Tax=unclassified Bartonella TaxID=2645622 RepID=UPI0015F8D460|nr:MULTISPECIES: GNAT family protein [unclassified Bartonella]UXN03480.1 GNAT family N-acetyltransferase [Bartonella sp. HY406]UXN06449.1 GNAT family N-acetyltransferase [Bartonella sp. HY761]